MTAAAAGGRLGRSALVGSTRGSLVAPRPQFSPLVSLGDPAVSLGLEASLLGEASTEDSLRAQLADLVLGQVASLVESRGECSSLLFEPRLSSAAALQLLSSDLIRTGVKS